MKMYILQFKYFINSNIYIFQETYIYKLAHNYNCYTSFPLYLSEYLEHFFSKQIHGIKIVPQRILHERET